MLSIVVFLRVKMAKIALAAVVLPWSRLRELTALARPSNWTKGMEGRGKRAGYDGRGEEKRRERGRGGVKEGKGGKRKRTKGRRGGEGRRSGGVCPHLHLLDLPLDHACV